MSVTQWQASPEEPWILSEASENLPFEFDGTGFEFFRIWIVNLVLTVLTLGIYSAWAKVRTTHYFWCHTRVGGAAFDYVANPVAILCGRLLVFFVLFMGAIVGTLSPRVEGILGIAILASLPWAVVRSLIFRARNTVHRGLRFDFSGSFQDAALAFLVLPIVLPFSLGLLYPAVVRAQRQFVVNGSAFGTERFQVDVPVAAFYRIFLRAGGSVFATVLLAGLAVRGLGDPLGPPLAITVLGVGGVLVYAQTQAGVMNLVFGGMRLGSHRFVSRIGRGELFVLYLTNALGLVATLGLFLPWARVRSARLRCSRLWLLPDGDLDSFVAGEVEAVGSVGDELADWLDLDLGL